METRSNSTKRMEMVKTMPELREKLWHNVKRLQQGLKDRGFDIGSTNSPCREIVPIGILISIVCI